MAELTIEDQFKIRAFEEQVKQMSGEQAKDMPVKVYQMQIAREAQYKVLLKHQWGIDNNG